MTTGEKILSMRKARSWSQEELAEHVGVSRQAVSRWEADSAMPDADKIVAICACFGVSADYLLGTGFPAECATQGDPGPREANRSPNARMLGFALLAFGLLCRFALEMVGVFRPHTHYSPSGVYHGFQAYVQLHSLQWMLWILWTLVTAGVLILLWDPVKKLIQKGCKT